MAKRHVSNQIRNALVLPLLLVAAGIMLDMIPDDSPFAPGKRILQFALNLLRELTKPDIVPYVIALLIAVVGGYWYWKNKKSRALYLNL